MIFVAGVLIVHRTTFVDESLLLTPWAGCLELPQQGADADLVEGLGGLPPPPPRTN